MDDSKQNIMMLLKATEIQKYWNPKFNDLFVCKAEFEYTGDTSLVYMHKRCDKSNKQGKIWVPSQFQLQKIYKEMLIKKEKQSGIGQPKTDWGILSRFFVSLHRESYWFKGGNSMEQLWLSFIMHEKWNKEWSGTEWIKK